MYNNKLTSSYQNYVAKPNNNIFNNNPIFESNIYDQNFYQKMQMNRAEQMRQVKKVSDLNMSKEQITEYVIAPIKVAKSNSSEIQKLFDEQTNMITQEFIQQNWWSNRTNAPYKTILKNEQWDKEYKSKDDLIVHKVSNLDKIGLMDDYKKLVGILERHNNDLKVVYSASKETEYKKQFKHVNKYKYKMKYDPKDYNDLKNYYKQEQKKYESEQKRIDELINRIMENDDISNDEIKQIETEILYTKKSKQNIEYEETHEVKKTENTKKKITITRKTIEPIQDNNQEQKTSRIRIIRRKKIE